MDRQYPANYRSDAQLEAILFETAAWTVNGRNGQILCTVSSLRQALDKAADFAASAAGAVAFCRMPTDNITVFDAQTVRLRKLCTDRETPPPIRQIHVTGRSVGA